MKALTYLLLIALLPQLACGCTSMRPVPTPDPRAAVATLSDGDTVRVVTSDNRTLQFRIASIQDGTLIGTQGERVAIDDIHMVSVQRADAGRSASAGFIAVVLGVTLYAISLL
jgi:hypothetical protein